MPEEILKYRVEIDSSDIGAQLDQIRNQIDSAIGASAAAVSSPSGMAPFLSTGFISGLDGSFASPDLINTINTGMARSLDFIGRAADRAQLGYSRFVDDARRIGLMSSPQFSMYTPAPSAAQAQLNQGWTGDIGGYFGIGYDPRGSLSFGEYQQMSAESIAGAAGNFASSFPAFLGGTIAGAMVGTAASPGFGTLIGAAVGLAADLTIGVSAGRARERNTLAEGIQNFTEPIFGGMTQNQFLRPCELPVPSVLHLVQLV